MSSERPLLSWVTPTRNRPERHEACYRDFCADAWEPKELVVLDESAEPSAFFGALRDPRVRYVHRPGPPRIDGVTRIGETRNRMVELAQGQILLHRDDDDHYAPGYSAAMVERLLRAGAAAAKLVVFRLVHEPTRTIFEWDLRRAGGKHYAVQGDRVAEVRIDPGELGADFGPEMMDAFRCGFGWSLVYRREIAQRYPFPAEGVEDIAFVQALERAGERVVFVQDCAHLGLHTVHVDPQHPTGGSAHFPQRKLGAAGPGARERLHAAIGQRMIGAMGGMTEISAGKLLRLRPGRTYAILASVRRKHSLRAMTVRAERWGIRLESARDEIAPEEFGVAAPDAEHRLVHAMGTVDKAVTVPWQAPSFLRILGERSAIVRAWCGDGEPEQTASIGTGAGSGELVQPDLEIVEEASLASSAGAGSGAPAPRTPATVQMHPHDGDIAILPGRVYVGTALVRAAHSSGAIASILEDLGVAIEQVKESPSDRGGYRFVRFRGVGSPRACGMLPWRLPWPLRVVDDTHVISCSFTPAPGSSGSSSSARPVGAGAAESFLGIPDGMAIERIVGRVDDLPGGLAARWTGAGRPIWESHAGAVVVQSPDSGRFAVLTAMAGPPHARGPVVTGAGASAQGTAITTLQNAQAQVVSAQAAVGNASASAQATWQQATSTGANDARVQAGTAAAASLVAHGYDPSDDADNQALVHAIAGGVSLIPTVGPILGAGIEVLDQIGQAAAGVLQALGIIPPPGCHFSGQPSMQDILAGFASEGAQMQPGTFGALAYPALAYNAIQLWTCQQGYGQDIVLEGCRQLWNQGALGQEEDCWVVDPILWTGYSTTTTTTGAQAAAQKALAQALSTLQATALSSPLYPAAQQAVTAAEAALQAAGAPDAGTSQVLYTVFMPTATPDPARFALAVGVGSFRSSAISLKPGPFVAAAAEGPGALVIAGKTAAAMGGVAAVASAGVAVSQGLPWHHYLGQAWGGVKTGAGRLRGR